MTFQRLDSPDAGFVAVAEQVSIAPNLSFYDYSKRVFDILTSLLALVVCVPIFAMTALAIKIESNGSVFYRQKRRGLGGDNFVIWKFRTMIDLPYPAEAVQGFPEARITRVGKFLRDTKIDELPQLLNVIAGDMSIIGPRPLSEEESLEIEQLGFAPSYPGFMHLTKPGLIGLEQIMRRKGEKLSYFQRFEFNHKYSSEASWQLDVYIFLVALIQCRFVCTLAALSAAAEALLCCS